VAPVETRNSARTAAVFPAMKSLRAAAVFLLFARAAAAQTPAEIHSWLEEVDARRNAFDEAVISARAT